MRADLISVAAVTSLDSGSRVALPKPLYQRQEPRVRQAV
jgi:hypothetical protein